MLDPQLFLALAFGERSLNFCHLRRQAHGDTLLEGIHETRRPRQGVAKPTHHLLLRRRVQQTFEEPLELRGRVVSGDSTGIREDGSSRDTANQRRSLQQCDGTNASEVGASQLDLNLASRPAQGRQTAGATCRKCRRH